MRYQFRTTFTNPYILPLYFGKNMNLLQNEKWYGYASLTSSSDPNKSTSSSLAAASPTSAVGTLFSPGNVLRSSPKEFIWLYQRKRWGVAAEDGFVSDSKTLTSAWLAWNLQKTKADNCHKKYLNIEVRAAGTRLHPIIPAMHHTPMLALHTSPTPKRKMLLEESKSGE